MLLASKQPLRSQADDDQDLRVVGVSHMVCGTACVARAVSWQWQLIFPLSLANGTGPIKPISGLIKLEIMSL